MQGIIILHFFLLLCLCSVLNWMSRSSLYTVCILGGPILSKCLSILVKPAILFSSLHGTGFAHFCSSFLHKTCWITERYAQKSRHTARRQFDCCSWLALEWEMRAQGEVPPLGRAAMAGLACSREPWQPSGERGSCWSPAGGRLERGLPPRRAGQLSLAGEHLGVTAASRAAAVSPAHTSEREASRHLVGDL